MYLIDIQKNRIGSVQKKKFGELGLSERNHLQEWIAHEPSALGEELLIIQKEFAGFDDTYERLDLLALDKQGNLVIIENKLDDSGRDVVWQAIKYASYCASLTKSQIVDIYEQYLDRYEAPGTVSGSLLEQESNLDAAERIQEFMGAPDFEEIKLNQGTNQRIMLVAANFRKEVTSTSLWLMGQGISVQCIKVSLFELGENRLLNIEQIIPPPEAKDFMISMGAKEAEEKTINTAVSGSQKVRMEYWEQAIKAFKASSCRLYDSITPNKSYLLLTRSSQAGCNYGIALTKQQLRIELWIEHSDTEHNKFIFDCLKHKKDSIEAVFDQSLDWHRKDSNSFSVIQLSRETDSYNKEKWPDFVAWHVEHMTRFEAALEEPLKEASEALESKLAASNSDQTEGSQHSAAKL